LLETVAGLSFPPFADKKNSNFSNGRSWAYLQNAQVKIQPAKFNAQNSTHKIQRTKYNAQNSTHKIQRARFNAQNSTRKILDDIAAEIEKPSEESFSRSSSIDLQSGYLPWTTEARQFILAF